MKNRMLLALFCLFVSASPLRACDCFGNNSYCETLSPTWFVNPSTTVLAVNCQYSSIQHS